MAKRRRRKTVDWDGLGLATAALAGLYGLAKKQEAEQAETYAQRLEGIIKTERAMFARLREENGILHERVAVLNKQVQSLERNKQELETENQRLQREIDNLQQQLVEPSQFE